MPHFIIKIKPYKEPLYAVWSTIVDSPITFFMKRDEFKRWYRRKYGSNGMSELPNRLERVEKDGCSSVRHSLKDLLEYNRAGKNERPVKTEKGLYKLFHKK